jgi:hypothetical protein
MCFPSYNFYLRGCLGEPTPFKTRLQFGWAQQLVRTNPRLNFTPKKQGVMGKLARFMTGVFGARHSNVGVRRCYTSEISKGVFIKVTIGLMEPMRMGDMITCLSNGQTGGRVTMLFKGVQCAFRVIPTQLRSQRYNALVETNENKINAPSQCWSLRQVPIIESTKKTSKQKFLTPTSNLTWLRAADRKFKSGANMSGIWLGSQYNNYRRLFALSNSYLYTLIL